MVRALGLVAVVVLGGCVGLVPDPGEPVSFGTSNEGVLLHGVALPDRGEGFVRARPGEPTRYGTPGLVGAIERAAAQVRRALPGGAPLRVGDLSAPSGGRHPRHASHRTGRDADLLFYARNERGVPLLATGFLRFDRFGTATVPAGVPGAGGVAFLDAARNWALVRGLLLDPRAAVQWIFCSNGVKSRLLTYAAAHEPSSDALFRAAWVLHEPSHGRRHDDHFHVRVACGARQRELGCVDSGPIWPWIRRAVEKPVEPAAPLTDARLVEALLAPTGPDGARSRFAKEGP